MGRVRPSGVGRENEDSIMRTAALLVLAAFLEVGGDALLRWGLRGGRWIGLALGAATLLAYGLSVNLSHWDFGRLLGVYIAVFFVVAQITSVVAFRERLQLPTIVGGVLIVAGGLVIWGWPPRA
jgi:small multidrug resistance family-3 protein